jgi:hypothetical protein
MRLVVGMIPPLVALPLTSMDGWALLGGALGIALSGHAKLRILSGRLPAGEWIMGR